MASGSAGRSRRVCTRVVSARPSGISSVVSRVRAATQNSTMPSVRRPRSHAARPAKATTTGERLAQARPAEAGDHRGREEDRLAPAQLAVERAGDGGGRERQQGDADDGEQEDRGREQAAPAAERRGPVHPPLHRAGGPVGGLLLVALVARRAGRRRWGRWRSGRRPGRPSGRRAPRPATPGARRSWSRSRSRGRRGPPTTSGPATARRCRPGSLRRARRCGRCRARLHGGRGIPSPPSIGTSARGLNPFRPRSRWVRSPAGRSQRVGTSCRGGRSAPGRGAGCGRRPGGHVVGGDEDEVALERGAVGAEGSVEALLGATAGRRHEAHLLEHGGARVPVGRCRRCGCRSAAGGSSRRRAPRRCGWSR